MARNSGELVVLLQLASNEPAPGKVLLTKKALAGIEQYVALWGGPVRILMPPGASSTGNLDDIVVSKSTLPFSVEVVPFCATTIRERVAGAAVVMGAADYRLIGLASLLSSARVPYVVNSENTLKARCQQAVASDETHILRKARLVQWEWRQEQGYRREVRQASGVQCNGTPTYESYARIARSALLYFDNRVRAHMLATEESIRAKLARHATRPLNLGFSGRLTAIKGADHLPRVAAALARRGVSFEMHVCGGGPAQASMSCAAQKLGVADRVRFRGVMDFETELVPFVRDEMDLFVCCHRQGDPSCTYVETFACGCPIAGYDNEAFAGLLERAGGGWATPMNSIEALADVIARISRDRSKLAAASIAALQFAAANTFEATFARRVEHLRSIAG